MPSEMCIVLCELHLVGIQETLELSTPAVGGHLKRVQEFSLSLVHIRSIQDPGQVEHNPALGVCIFEVYNIRAKWNLTRL